jgi:hypothetical protein
MELFHAHNQWATRPQDEKFRSLEALYTATKGYADAAREKTVPWGDLRTEAIGEDLALVGKAGVPARLTHHAFGQLAAKVGAPASYLRELPPTLAAQNLNHGLKGTTSSSNDAMLLFHQNGNLVLRAATSEKYSRIWNYEVVERLIGVSQRYNLTPAKSTFRTFDSDENPALYASDHDMFAFLMSMERQITGPLGESLFRGIITVNSEVGASSLKILSFMFREICGNHIIWGAEQIAEVRLVHRGDIRERWNEATAQVKRYFDGAASLDEARFATTMVQIGGTKDEVLDRIFGLRKSLPQGTSRKLLEAGYDAVVPDEDGSPKTVWGLAQGLTRYSQTIGYADERQMVDRVAGKVLDLVF